MLYELDNDGKRKQFTQVIEHLMKNGHKQKEIATRIGLTTYDISHLISGERKNISWEVIDNLHEEFHINPNFIVKGATNMYDIPGIKYENFENFVDSWDLVEHENKEYLHFAMDEKFYEFLIDVFNLKEASSKTDANEKMAEAFDKILAFRKKNLSKKDYLYFSTEHELYKFVENVFNNMDNFSNSTNSKEMKKAFDKAFESLKADYQPSKNPRDYVLIPADVVLEIAEHNVSRRKHIAEFVNIIDIYPVKK